MKKLICFVIAAMLLSAVPTALSAQSNDPLEQQTLKATNHGSTKREKKIDRKKKAPTEAPQAAPVKEEPKPAPKPQPVVVEVEEPSNEMTISNPCDEWLDVEFVSLIGSKASQTLNLTLKVTNHGVNRNMNIGGSFVAYDNEGVEHTRGWAPESYKTLTDVPFKTSFDVPGKINPSKTEYMPAMSFKIGDCDIEMRNVPINWK